MTEKDVLLLLTHGALSGVCARPPISSSADIGRQAVEAAQHALDVLKASGITWDDSDEPATPPLNPTVPPPGGYNPSAAQSAPVALSLALDIRKTDLPLTGVDSALIREFQYAAGLKADGVAGPKTLAAYLYWSEQK